MESKKHIKIKQEIYKLFKRLGYEAEMEHRLGKYTYDIMIKDKDKKKIFIEVYMYPPRLNFKQPNMKCYNCGYEWYTESKMKKPTCPSCTLKVNIKKGIGE